MCGIAGLYSQQKDKSPEFYKKTAKAMADAIAHRGPDDSGVWCDNDFALALSHRRLSIIDLTKEGHQPKASHSARYVMTYNGETYNFIALQKELEDQGAQFTGRSDTEVILAGFDIWGVSRTLQKIKGMFAFALYDRRDKKLYFVRDRFGKKPLYIGRFGNHLLFGSELKSLAAHPFFVRQLCKQALQLYMRYGYVPAPYAIYQNVMQLLPGHVLCLDLTKSLPDNLKTESKAYWSLSDVHDNAQHKNKDISFECAKAETKALLKSAVKMRMVSDVPVGCFLSGGVDSSLVAGVMQESAAQKIKTFSIGFEDKSYNEAPMAAGVAAHLGTDHSEMIVSAAQAMDVIPQLSSMYDEPFADASQIPTYLVSRFARQSVTVALSGDGGDELCGGYARHFIAPQISSRAKPVPFFVQRMLAKAILKVPADRWNSLSNKGHRFGERVHKAAHFMLQNNVQHGYDALMVHWHDLPLAYDEGEAVIPLHDDAFWPRYMNSKSKGFEAVANMMIFGDALTYLPNDVLVKVDRASMACALEVRAPLLDTDLYEYVTSLPLSMKIRKNDQGQIVGKYLLREILYDYVPKDLVERPKQGFSMPIGVWLRGDLRDWAEDLLAPEKLKDNELIDKAMVSHIWKDHLDGNGSHAERLWTMLIFLDWQKRWLA